ncbi:MAG: ribosome small subunit-dependent GTPase A [Micrococcales bacterium]|nr:ribosome small subunit-dependent GTPase A [Micrococcales bacterium]
MPNSKWDHLDEDHVRVRPSRGSRPRSKVRPAHADALTGQVTAVDRGRYQVHLDQQAFARQVWAVGAKELGHRSVVVGDAVDLVGDTSGTKDTLARIVRVRPRRTQLRRATEQGRGRERVIVANAELLVAVVALANPEPRPRLIDRVLVAAYDGGLEPVICLTKADLGPAGELTALYQPLGVKVVTTSRAAKGQPIRGLDGLRQIVTGRSAVMAGHSGVGKSTLMNALVPGAGRATGQVNQVTGRGRHTSSNAVALGLPEGGWLIDTPGVRSFGIDHVADERILAAFPDLAAVAQAECPRGCPHLDMSLDCALAEWAQHSPPKQARVESFQRLVASRYTTKE